MNLKHDACTEEHGCRMRRTKTLRQHQFRHHDMTKHRQASLHTSRSGDSPVCLGRPMQYRCCAPPNGPEARVLRSSQRVRSHHRCAPATAWAKISNYSTRNVKLNRDTSGRHVSRGPDSVAGTSIEPTSIWPSGRCQ